jgi:Bacterial Ig domain/NPCBM-associated, NEW3 domain of alpha-galactosidase
MKIRNLTPKAVVLTGVVLALSLAIIPVAFAKGKPGGGGGCISSAPTVAVQNNWQWGASGSWGLPGQQIGYMILLQNKDAGCGSSTFTLSVTGPSGFSVAVPTSTVSLRSGSYAYLWAYVTPPAGLAAGDYTLTVSAARTNGPSASAATAYKLYSSDTTVPTLFWPNPGDGTTISGRSYNLAVSSSDDHSVKKIDLYLDGAYVSTTTCDDITYICQLNYSWSPRTGQHTATFKSYDWMGNVGTLTVSFTVS